MKKTISWSDKQTRERGREMARELVEQGPGEKARVLGLVGELGSGKTTFVQGFGSGLGIDQREIKSPTYLIMRRYGIKEGKGFGSFYHIDAYRVEGPDQVLNLGFADICRDPRNIVLIEWADRIERILPSQTRIIRFSFLDKGRREILPEK